MRLGECRRDGTDRQRFEPVKYGRAVLALTRGSDRTRLNTNYLSAAIPISEKSAFGIDWMQVGIDDDELDAKQNRFNFSYSYRPFNSLSVGMSLKHFTR